MERIILQHTVCDILTEEFLSVIATHPERCLRQIIRAVGEELRLPGDFVCSNSGARQLNHRADEKFNVNTRFFKDSLRRINDYLALQGEFVDMPDERNHNLRQYLNPALRDIYRGFKDGARLHHGYLRIHNAESATAMSQHRVKFVQLLHALTQFLRGDTETFREFIDFCLRFRQEFVQRRIQRADSHGITRHCFKNTDKIRFLVR